MQPLHHDKEGGPLMPATIQLKGCEPYSTTGNVEPIWRFICKPRAEYFLPIADILDQAKLEIYFCYEFWQEFQWNISLLSQSQIDPNSILVNLHFIDFSWDVLPSKTQTET